MAQSPTFLRNIIQLNFAMLLISTSGVLGRSIPLWPPITIGLRALLAASILFIFIRYKKINLRIAREDRLAVFFGGILMGVHWVTYFQALQLSNVAIGMLTIFTYPALTSLLEPLLLKTSFQRIHLLLGLLVFIGIVFIAPDLNFENEYTQAVGYGLLSALAYSLRNIIMKKEIEKYHGSLLMGYQMVIIGVLLLPFSLQVSISNLMSNLPLLLVLAMVTTAIGHTLFLMTFKHFNITTASIISSTQPLYGIIIGFFILGESPQWSTVIGGLLIVSAVLIESLRTAKKSSG